MNKKTEEVINRFRERFVFCLVNKSDDMKIYGEDDQRVNIEQFLQQELEAVEKRVREETVNNVFDKLFSFKLDKKAMKNWTKWLSQVSEGEEK